MGSNGPAQLTAVLDLNVPLVHIAEDKSNLATPARLLRRTTATVASCWRQLNCIHPADLRLHTTVCPQCVSSRVNCQSETTTWDIGQ